MEINKLIVHGGVFHADDVMCAAIAKEINPNVEILRVRNVPETVEEGTVVADIGGGKYDHHQKDAEVRENGEKYAACGLLLRDCWQDMFPNEEGYKQFEQNVIMPIERADNGMEKNPLSLAVSSFVPNWDSEESMDEAFDKATDFMKGFLDRTLETEISKVRAEEIVENGLNEMYKTGRDTVILDKFAPWQSVLVPSDANYVIYPGARGGYNLQCVPKEMGSFDTKQPLPDKWLEEKPNGCTFVHNNKFLASFNSFEDALNAANSLQKEQNLTIYKQIAIEENTNIIEEMAEYNKSSENRDAISDTTKSDESKQVKKEYVYLVKEEIDEPDPEDSYYRSTGSHYIGAFKTIEAAEKRESSLFMEEFHKEQEDKEYMEETFPSWKEDLLEDNPKYKDYSNDELKEKYKRELDEYKVSKYYSIEVIPMVSYDIKLHGEFLDGKEIEVDEDIEI